MMKEEKMASVALKPGGEALTKKAIEKAGLPKGAKVLDVGCGEGGTVALLAGCCGFDVVGVDLSSNLIDRGRKQHPGTDLRCMEAEFLDFESKSFDAVLMECSLSVFRLQEDALFEAYCLLKPGGKLIITDLYIRNPDPVAVAGMLLDAQERAGRPKVEGACGENERPSFIMLDGALVVDELHGLLEEMGFVLECFEDESGALASFAAQAIMGHGSLDEYFKAVVPEGDDPAAYCACAAFCGGSAAVKSEKAEKIESVANQAPTPCKPSKNLGYFLMVLKKA
jgi:SAM-dependent methyltransferase